MLKRLYRKEKAINIKKKQNQCDIFRGQKVRSLVAVGESRSTEHTTRVL
jgi:hypothetical protein